MLEGRDRRGLWTGPHRGQFGQQGSNGNLSGAIGDPLILAEAETVSTGH
jgi:hypothetical protein